MRLRTVSVLVALALWITLASVPAAAQHGQISGNLSRADGSALAGVEVKVGGATALSDAAGSYTVRVPPGVYTVIFSADNQSHRVSDVRVEALSTVRLDQELDWGPTTAAQRMVSTPSARAERYLDTSTALVVVDEGTIAAEAAHGQAPRLVEHEVGVELAQSGLFAFNLSSRGFNDVLNSRLSVRLDGRDTSMLFFGGQEWASLTQPLDDYAQVELLRGPSSTLYGTDSTSGTLSLITRNPSGGGLLRVAGGEASTLNGDVAYSPSVGSRSYFKLLGSHREGEPTTVSRNFGGEYAALCAFPGQFDCLPAEAVPLGDDTEDATSASVRYGHHFSKGVEYWLEGGMSDLSGTVLLTDIGRLQVLDSDWMWWRTGMSSLHWDLQMTFRNRDAPRQTALSNGNNLVLDEDSWGFNGQTQWSLTDKIDLLVGGFHEDELIDTAALVNERPRAVFNPLSRDGSLFLTQVDEEADGVFAHFDFRPTDRLRLTVGARYDDSSYFEPQWSPRLGLVFEIDSQSSLRVNYSEGFVAPTYEQLDVQFDIIEGINLAVIEPQCRLHGVTCGFDLDANVTAQDAPLDRIPDTRQLLVGNANLKVEETQTFEVGYRGQLGDIATVNIAYHFSEHDNLIGGPIPNVGTSLGRLNPDYGPYIVPLEIPARADIPDDLSELPSREEILAQIQAILGGLFPFLSTNIEDGTPLLALNTYANIGSADTQGVDFDVQLRFDTGFNLGLTYSWLDSDPSGPSDLVQHLALNAPENQGALRVGYSADRWNAELKGRWVDTFRWVSPPFGGFVEDYISVDLFANIHVNDTVSLGLSVANLTDDNHFQLWGGDILERRALGQVTIHW